MAITRAKSTVNRNVGLGRSGRVETARPFFPKTDSGGGSLSSEVREKMEQSFGHDFSQVRIHSGHEAAAVGADAFTRGHHIYFTPGMYQPSSRSGLRLLGHELTHVVQQQAGRVAVPQGKDIPINASPGLEREADVMGARAAQGLQVNMNVAESGKNTKSMATSANAVQCGAGPSRPAAPERPRATGTSDADMARLLQARIAQLEAQQAAQERQRQAAAALAQQRREAAAAQAQTDSTVSAASTGISGVRAVATAANTVNQEAYNAHTSRLSVPARTISMNPRTMRRHRGTRAVVGATGAADAALLASQGNYGQSAATAASSAGSLLMTGSRHPLHRGFGAALYVGSELTKGFLQTRQAQHKSSSAQQAAQKKDDQ